MTHKYRFVIPNPSTSTLRVDSVRDLSHTEPLPDRRPFETPLSLVQMALQMSVRESYLGGASDARIPLLPQSSFSIS
jgi:hypothetical protein